MTRTGKAAEHPALAHATARASAANELRALYRDHAGAVARRVAALTGDFSGAADLAQEAFVIAWRSWERCPSGADRTAWIFGIALNVARNARRRLRRRAFFHRTTKPEPATMTAGPDELLIGERTADALLAAFRSLSPQRQEAFGLRVLEGLPLSECSAILGVPETTISHRAKRAEQSLREALDRTQGD